ncbi:MAG: hypothetical protein GEV10_22675 [Streptosporangiales bacterium]|nr:hypothetical protein [Streptosporangiales bacterium]
MTRPTVAARRSRSRSRAPGPDGPKPDTLAASGPPGDPESVARTICLRLLAATPRTRAELAEALAKREVPDDAAERVLDRFTEVGLVDDVAYAEAWVRTRQAGRGLARRALAHELRRRGVDETVVQSAVDTIDPDDERATARALVDRKLPASRRLDRDKRVRRLAGMLARKGYSTETALKVVNEALAEERDS